MARVMFRCVYGLDYEDFVQVCQEARNFRDYFRGTREDLLKECQTLKEASDSQDEAATGANRDVEKGGEDISQGQEDTRDRSQDDGHPNHTSANK